MNLTDNGKALPVKRLLARHVIVDGVDHGLCVAEFAADGSLVAVTPFTEEIHSTVYVGDKLLVTSY